MYAQVRIHGRISASHRHDFTMPSDEPSEPNAQKSTLRMRASIHGLAMRIALVGALALLLGAVLSARFARTLPALSESVAIHALLFGAAALLFFAAAALLAWQYALQRERELAGLIAAAAALRAGDPIPQARAAERPNIHEFVELHAILSATAEAARVRSADAEREIGERQRAESALVESEKRMRRMIDEVPQALFAVTPDGQPMLVNHRLAELYGCTPEQLLADPAPLLRDPWLTGASTVVIGDGAFSRVLEVNRVPFPHDANTFGTLIVGNDVTESRQLQMQLNQASRMHAIGQLAGGIAHEFNNLLTPISGHAELLRARLDDPELQRPLDAITSASTRARQLIRQVLSFSRTTEQLFERVPTAIGPVLEEVGLLMRGSLPSSIEFRVQIERGLPLVLADPGQLHQVLVNLCTNAAQAIDAANSDRQRAAEAGGEVAEHLGGRIDVIADAIHADDLPTDVSSDGQSGVRVRVLDNGIGMPPDVMARVFDPFFSTKLVSSQSYSAKHGEQGTGLGLAVAKGIVEAHRGQIRVDSSPGWATCFEILLPGLEASSTHATTAPAETAATPTGAVRHVLVVDDAADVLIVMGEMLRALGYRVSTATSGERALELFSGGNAAAFDLVITDNSMPGMDGHSLARRLRSQFQTLPVVMLTGLMDEDAQPNKAIDLQLMKPIGLAELQRALQGLLSTAD